MANPLEVLLLVVEGLVELHLRLSVFLATGLEVGDAVVSLLSYDARDVLQVVEQDFALLLLLRGLKQLVDFLHVVELLREVLLRVHQSVEQVAVLAVLLRLEVEGVEEFEQTLRELRDFDVGRTRLDFALHHRNLHVLLRKQLLLLDHFVVLLLVLGFDLAQD